MLKKIDVIKNNWVVTINESTYITIKENNTNAVLWSLDKNKDKISIKFFWGVLL